MKSMEPSAKLNPATLVPGQKVRLHIKGRNDVRSAWTWIVQRHPSPYKVFWTPQRPDFSLELAVNPDGMLQDSQGRIVEVRDAG